MGNQIQGDHESEPLVFHQVHADNVELSHEGRKVRRRDGQRGLCFSNRPVLLRERVYLRITESAHGRRNKELALRFGFTSVDPAADSNRSFSSGEISLSDHGYWVKPLSETIAKRGVALFFYLEVTGEVIYGRKDEEYGVLFGGIRTDVPLWVVVDLAGTASAVEFLDVGILPSSSKGETSNMTKAAVAKYRQRNRNMRLSRSTDALPTTSQEALEQTMSNVASANRQNRRADDLVDSAAAAAAAVQNSTDNESSSVAAAARVVMRPSENPRHRMSLRSSSVVETGPERSGFRHSSLTPTTAREFANATGMVSGARAGQESTQTPVADHEPPAYSATALPSEMPPIYMPTSTVSEPVQMYHSEDHASSTQRVTLYSSIVNEPVSFSSAVCGRNVEISDGGRVATRKDGEYNNAYVFTERPLMPDDVYVIKVAGTVSTYRGGMTVGLTTHNPTQLRSSDLPDDPHKLLDRPEYWVFHRDVHTRPKNGNEIALHLRKSGELRYIKNGRDGGTLMHVDCSLPLWVFIDVWGITNKIESIGIVRRSGPPRLTANNPPPPPSRAHIPPPVSRMVSSSATNGDQIASSSARSGHSSSPANRTPAAESRTAAAAAADVGRAIMPHNVRSAPVLAAVSSSEQRARSSGNVGDPFSDALPSLPPPLIPVPRPRNSSSVSGQQQQQQQQPQRQTSNDVATLIDISPVQTPAKKHESSHAECAICLEREPDSALYPCGHLCMCYSCALSVQKQRSSLCPMCRQPIVDVLRIFRT